MARSGDLVTPAEAAEALGILEAEVGRAVDEGRLREVWLRPEPGAGLERRILASDVARIRKQTDPGHLAAMIRGDSETEYDEDDESPAALAARIPR